MKTLYLVLFLPLLTAIFIRLGGARMSKRAVSVLATSSVFVAFGFAIMSFIALSRIEPPRAATLIIFEWLRLGSMSIDFSLLLDPLSAVMICVITGVGTLIHLYSSAYMEEEEGTEFARYYSYLNFFIFSMLTLVLSANFVVMFIGWELVGVSSYLLIGFYRTKESAANAGKKAFIVNRIGDLGFVLAIFVLMGVFGSTDFNVILPSANQLGVGSVLATTTALLLFMGAMGKSAQVPLHVWLPDAMEGPTPVSALIHAATMVTAGVFMISRCHAIFELSPVAMHAIAWIGAITAIFAASIGLVQNDIKRVMAYSTLSQLGYMIMAVGVGAYSAGFFHLFTHAFFKALLFLGCGSVMHALHGELDMTKMGGLRSKLPITYWTVLVGCLCLVGFPGTSGFFSKDEILYQVLTSAHGSIGLWMVGTLTSLMTAFYVSRFFFKVFHGKTRLDHNVFEHAHESSAPMAVPLLALAVLSIGAGLLGLPHFISHWQPFEHWLAPVFSDLVRSEGHSESLGLPIGLMALYTLLAISGIGVCWRLFANVSETPTKIAVSFSYLHQLLWNKYYIDEIYDFVFVRTLFGMSRRVVRWIDQGMIDGSIHLISDSAQSLGIWSREKLHNGYARFYAGALVFGTVLMLALALFTN